MVSPTSSRISVVAGALASLNLVAGFSNTYPLVAWSSHQLQSLALLSPSHHTNSPSVFRQATAQTPFSDPTQTDDLCSLSTVLLISIPGLHSSDLSLLPSSEYGVRAAITHAEKSKTGNAMSELYVPFTEGSTGTSQAGATAQKVAKKFVSECGAVVEKLGEANLWAGEMGKTVRIEVVEGLDEWELVGGAAKSERAKIMQNVDAIVSGQLQSLPGPYLVILTSIPTSVTSAITSTLHHKRQFSEYSGDADDFPEIELDWENEASPSSKMLKAAKPKATSIFAVDPKSGLLHRYVFFTQPLIFALIIALVLLIPVVLLSTSALTSIETLAGLESKMTGSVGVDPSKASN